jgi:hypothetical protein
MLTCLHAFENFSVPVLWQRARGAARKSPQMIFEDAVNE